ncbi:uncharacterized protein EAE98_002868 [Botrytis deweyae]|uniref:Uncharacterized protein n=1 Tax=Botrytis deweyae TaxID=2478750 RepID=A0ABQ7IV02_9HELO|nr:uncharacterized protein EAE98_002868 [Botrytis deweyae]KAF7934823.1 hypothetical protein EAE98_002868 [Botrytis deweyae]
MSIRQMAAPFRAGAQPFHDRATSFFGYPLLPVLFSYGTSAFSSHLDHGLVPFKYNLLQKLQETLNLLGSNTANVLSFRQSS